MTPAAVTWPQWPWSVAPHRHTSAHTSSCGQASLMAAMACAASPFGSRASLACASLCSGAANSSTAGTPAAAAAFASFTASSTESWEMPGMLSTAWRTPRPGTTNSG